MLSHNYIGTEHILLGLLREEEGLAAQVLESLGITVEGVRAEVTRVVGQGDEQTTGQIPFTPRAKKVLELSLREALSLGHDYIGTEHILLALVRENSGVAARILYDSDASAHAVASATLRKLGASPQVADEVTRRSFSDRPSLPPAKERQISLTTGSYPFWLTPFFMGKVVPILAGTGLLGFGILIGWLIWG